MLVKIRKKLYEVSTENRRKALEAIRDQGSECVKVVPGQFAFQQVADSVEDWTFMTSAAAGVLLMGVDALPMTELANRAENLMSGTTPPKYRFVTVEGTLYQITEDNWRRLLTTARDMQSTHIAMNPNEFDMVAVSTDPVADLTDLTSAEAEALLLGLSPDTTEAIAAEQVAIEADESPTA